MKTQTDTIKKKSAFLYVRLYPYLSNATADARKDMWRSMILPLFNAVLILLYFDRTKTNTWRTLRLLVGTFKRFMMIPKNTSTELVTEMMGNDIPELVCVNAVNAEEKWEARKERRQPELTQRTQKPNYLRGIPNDWCQILKQQCSLCPLCRNSIRNEAHMEIIHKTEIFSYKEIWSLIKNYQDEVEEIQKKKKTILKVKRSKYLDYWKPKLKALKEDTNEKFKLIYALKNFLRDYKPNK